LRIKAKLKAASESGKRVNLRKTISGYREKQGIEKERKLHEKLLQASDLDPVEVCTTMYDSDWNEDIWNRPDGSDKEIRK